MRNYDRDPDTGLTNNLLGATNMSEVTATSPEAIVDGTPVTATPSALVTIRQNWELQGSKVPSKKDLERLKEAYKQASAKASAADAQASGAREAVYAASRALAEAIGAQPFKLDGVRHDFSSRGEKVFLKSKGEEKDLLAI